MKTTPLPRLFLSALLGLAASAVFAAHEAAPAANRVTVTFVHPENFTDLKESSSDWENEWGRKEYLPQFKEHIEKEAESLLPAGQKLAVQVTDIDLAGDFEPWRGPRFSDVRIIKDIYIPRIALTFQLTDARGKVLKEGERKLSDMAFQMRLTSGFPDDPLRYEKSMLTDWLRTELAVR
jgi:hypothetical protein